MQRSGSSTEPVLEFMDNHLRRGLKLRKTSLPQRYGLLFSYAFLCSVSRLGLTSVDWFYHFSTSPPLFSLTGNCSKIYFFNVYDILHQRPVSSLSRNDVINYCVLQRSSRKRSNGFVGIIVPRKDTTHYSMGGNISTQSFLLTMSCFFETLRCAICSRTQI